MSEPAAGAIVTVMGSVRYPDRQFNKHCAVFSQGGFMAFLRMVWTRIKEDPSWRVFFARIKWFFGIYALMIGIVLATALPNLSGWRFWIACLLLLVGVCFVICRLALHVLGWWIGRFALNSMMSAASRIRFVYRDTGPIQMQGRNGDDAGARVRRPGPGFRPRADQKMYSWLYVPENPEDGSLLATKDGRWFVRENGQWKETGRPDEDC